MGFYIKINCRSKSKLTQIGIHRRDQIKPKLGSETKISHGSIEYYIILILVSKYLFLDQIGTNQLGYYPKIKKKQIEHIIILTNQ